MDEKFRQGLANQVLEQHDNILNIREEFINCKADMDLTNTIEDIAKRLMAMYLDITRPVKD